MKNEQYQKYFLNEDLHKVKDVIVIKKIIDYSTAGNIQGHLEVYLNNKLIESSFVTTGRFLDQSFNKILDECESEAKNIIIP